MRPIPLAKKLANKGIINSVETDRITIQTLKQPMNISQAIQNPSMVPKKFIKNGMIKVTAASN